MSTQALRTRRRWLGSAAATLLAPLAGGWSTRPARAAEPTGPVRIVVAYPPGGVSDATARALAEALAPRLGVPVWVTHRPGAGGALAMQALAHAVPDGRTLVFSAITPLTLGPSDRTLGFDPRHDIVPVISVMLTPVLLLATPALPRAVAPDLGSALAWGRSPPGALRWATSGLGTTGHLVLQQVAHASGVTVTHVPYHGGGAQLNDALGGQFELLSSNVAAAQLALLREGRLRALAVGAPSRLPVLPDVPTFAELGFPDANLASEFGLFVPAGTPAARREWLHDAVADALKTPALRQRLLAADNLPTGDAAEAFAARIERARAAAPGR
ncbi:MAG: tripartite tricarboxylate transporter substrate binding protein [Rubrivivax sp.]